MSLPPSVQNLWLELTDVTLADEDTNSLLTDNAKRAIQGNEAVQVMQTGDQCKSAPIVSGRLLKTKFAANSNGAK